MMRDFTSHNGPVIPIASSSSIRNSFSRSSLAFIAGFALGTVAGAFGVKYVSYLLSLNRRSDRLLRELESVQQNFENRTVGSVSLHLFSIYDLSTVTYLFILIYLIRFSRDKITGILPYFADSH